MKASIENSARVPDAAAVVELVGRRPQLLALGEPTHGEEALLDLRNDLFEQLTSQEGYRTIAVESDCLMGKIVNDYVVSGVGDLDEVMERGFSHGWGDREWGGFAANRRLVAWMREYNVDRPASEQVHFAGFDGPLEISEAASPRQALVALYDYLEASGDASLLPCTAEELDRLIGADSRWTEPAAMMDHSRSVGRTAEAKELRLIADDLAALLDALAPQLISATSRNDWDDARLWGRTATGLLRYHFAMADPSANRLSRMLAIRDSMMAANLLDLAERGPTLVSAHNAHLQRRKSSMQMGEHRVEWWSAGAILSARLGAEYAFLASGIGAIGEHGVGAPPSGTVEGVLYALDQDRCLVDAHELSVAVEATVIPRVSPWFGYAPLDPAHLTDTDGILFVKGTEPRR